MDIPLPKLAAVMEPQWRAAVFARDNHACVLCGARKYLQAHHIVTRAFSPLRFDIDNGATLCRRCHGGHNWHESSPYSAHHNGLWLLYVNPQQVRRLVAKMREVCENGNYNNPIKRTPAAPYCEPDIDTDAASAV